MAEFKTPMYWSDENCSEPGEIAQTGYSIGDSPAAEHENYFRRQTYLCLTELQGYMEYVDNKISDYVDDNTPKVESLISAVEALTARVEALEQS